MLAYNHGEFISEAIESVLMQQTSYSYKIIIAEDCSTDNTRNIILEYQAKYADRFKVILQEVNVGAQKNNIVLLSNLEGKYVAALEGDDYWTDPFKLQKQINFLEKNSDVIVCGSNYFTFNGGKNINIFRNTSTTDALMGDFNDIVKSNMIPTLTAVFKNSFSLLNLRFLSKAPYADWVLWAYLLNNSGAKFAILPDFTSVQNIHSGGVFSSITDKEILVRNNLKCWIAMFSVVNFNNKILVAYEVTMCHNDNPELFKSNKDLSTKLFFKLFYKISSRVKRLTTPHIH